MHSEATMTGDLPLRGLQLPEAVGVWPLAPGWWLLLVALLLFLGGACFWRYRHRRRLRRLGLARLRRVADLPDPQLARSLSRLLRQLAIHHYSPEVAGLTGRKWLAFLDRPFADQPFSHGVGRCLIEAPYGAEAQLDSTALVALCRRWIQQLPPEPRDGGGRR